MADESPPPEMDLRDHRGRLIRLAIAAAIGLAITIVVMQYIAWASSGPNTDPVGAATVPLLAIAIFVVTTAAATSVLARFARRT